MSTDAPSTTFASVLVTRVARQLGLDLTDLEVDHDASFFDPGGFRFGGVPFDSMDFVELLAALEDEVGVAILDAPDVEAFDTVSKLAAYIEDNAPAERLAAFRGRWS